jgi:hypothetical protein
MNAFQNSKLSIVLTAGTLKAHTSGNEIRMSLKARFIDDDSSHIFNLNEVVFGSSAGPILCTPSCEQSPSTVIDKVLCAL